MLCAQALVSFFTNSVAMYATVSWPRAPQAYALVPKSDNRAKEVYMLSKPGIENLTRLRHSKDVRPSFSYIFHADHLGLYHGSASNCLSYRVFQSDKAKSCFIST